MIFIFPPDIEKKLRIKHEVSTDEVEQCFWNRRGDLLIDNREDHKTDPPSLWFISETDKRRKLKVIFVQRDDKIFIKSCFPASEKAIKDYRKKTAIGS